VRGNHEYRTDPYSQTAAQSGDRLHMSGKGGVVM
jgi:hypothetical protein